jgi:hypothetical protein
MQGYYQRLHLPLLIINPVMLNRLANQTVVKKPKLDLLNICTIIHVNAFSKTFLLLAR